MPLQQKNFDPAVMAGADLDLNVDLGEILDSNSNEMLEFDAVASAVNFFRLTNSATGNRVELSARGEDTNVGMDLTVKGSGILRFVMATVSSINTGGALDASGLSGADPVFVITSSVSTTSISQAQVSGTNAQTFLARVTVGGTTRYIRLYD